MNNPNQNPVASPAKAADLTTPPPSNVSPLLTPAAPATEAAKAPLTAVKGSDAAANSAPKS